MLACKCGPRPHELKGQQQQHQLNDNLLHDSRLYWSCVAAIDIDVSRIVSATAFTSSGACTEHNTTAALPPFSDHGHGLAQEQHPHGGMSLSASVRLAATMTHWEP